jgi:hypothetical protein
MEIGAVVLAVLAGVGSGFLSAVASPFAQRRAEEARLRTQARRERIDQGRALLAEARRGNWGGISVGADTRFTELRPYLPQDIQDRYKLSGVEQRTLAVGRQVHNELMNAIDDLEKAWKLV